MVLLADNSRVSTDTTLVLRDLAKISSITPNTDFCHSGSLSTTQVLHRMTRHYANSQAIWSQDSSPPTVSVAVAVEVEVEVLRKFLQNVKWKSLPRRSRA
jgi:20S proteasome alpha/beta subunit